MSYTEQYKTKTTQSAGVGAIWIPTCVPAYPDPESTHSNGIITRCKYDLEENGQLKYFSHSVCTETESACDNASWNNVDLVDIPSYLQEEMQNIRAKHIVRCELFKDNGACPLV